MGSLIELNDTLRISKEQGFPPELVYNSIQENRKREFTDELNADMSSSKTKGNPDRKVAGGRHEKHLDKPFKAEDFKDKIFEFKDKSEIRLFQQPPVRTFFVEDVNGKWLHWGLVHMLEIKHDYINKTTFGKFKIVEIYTPKEMRKAFKMIFKDGVGPDYFAK